MATIRVRVVDGRRRVTISGRLVAADLRRLEQACGPALEYRELPLEVQVDPAGIDEPARLFLRNLTRRGASVTEGLDEA